MFFDFEIISIQVFNLLISFRWYNTAETERAEIIDKDLWAGFDSNLPAEWESWLRFRRTEPPTDDEVLKVSAPFHAYSIHYYI